MGALLALASALSYGLSDVVGGLMARRASPVRVALLGQIGGLAVMAFTAPLLAGVPAHPSALAWGALSGVGTGVAMTFLFRGISRGAMSTVVPVSAVGGVVLPVLAGLLVLGERPPAPAWVGIALAIPSLWLISGGPGRTGGVAPDGITDGLASSVGIAVQYLALAQAAPAAGVWPVAAGRVTAVVAVAVLASRLTSGADDPGPLGTARLRLGAAFAGSLAALALACYLFATHTQFVSVAVVLSSLYPVVPVLWGIVALREQPGRTRTLGLFGGLAASVLVAVA